MNAIVWFIWGRYGFATHYLVTSQSPLCNANTKRQMSRVICRVYNAEGQMQRAKCREYRFSTWSFSCWLVRHYSDGISMTPAPFRLIAASPVEKHHPIGSDAAEDPYEEGHEGGRRHEGAEQEPEVAASGGRDRRLRLIAGEERGHIVRLILITNLRFRIHIFLMLSIVCRVTM